MYTPTSILGKTTQPRPIWFNFHGNPDTAGEYWKYTSIQTKAEAEGFFSVYPQGIDVVNGDALDGPSWNSEGCCGQPQSGAADDKAFVLAMIREVTAAGCVDTSKIWASGLSAGAYFSGYLACKAGDVFSAVAIVAGLSGIDVTDPAVCPYARAIPILALHSLGDVQVSYTGGVPGCTARNPTSTAACKTPSDEFFGIEGLVAAYAKRQGCQSAVRQIFANSTAKVGAVVCKAHAGCPAGHSAVNPVCSPVESPAIHPPTRVKGCVKGAAQWTTILPIPKLCGLRSVACFARTFCMRSVACCFALYPRAPRGRAVNLARAIEGCAHHCRWCVRSTTTCMHGRVQLRSLYIPFHSAYV
jgi:poly(3-hydroxybutyrate) depolymerase